MLACGGTAAQFETNSLVSDRVLLLNQVVCLVAELGDSLAKTQLYCELGMVDGKCTPDGLCSTTCDASEAIIQRSRRAQTQVRVV